MPYHNGVMTASSKNLPRKKRITMQQQNSSSTALISGGASSSNIGTSASALSKASMGGDEASANSILGNRASAGSRGKN